MNDGISSVGPSFPRSAGRSSIRIIGVGNEWRGDDAAGLLVARWLCGRMNDQAEVIEAENVGVELLEQMKEARLLLLIDAAHSGEAPGTIHRVDASAGPVARCFRPRSTHAIGVAEIIELARTLEVLPQRVVVYGIEVAATEWGQSLSQPVKRAIEEVVGLIAKEIKEQLCMNST